MVLLHSRSHGAGKSIITFLLGLKGSFFKNSFSHSFGKNTLEKFMKLSSIGFFMKIFRHVFWQFSSRTIKIFIFLAVRHSPLITRIAETFFNNLSHSAFYITHNFFHGCNKNGWWKDTVLKVRIYPSIFFKTSSWFWYGYSNSEIPYIFLKVPYR